MEQAEINELVELFSEFLKKKNEAKTYGVQMKSYELKSAIANRLHAMTISDLVDTPKIRWAFSDGVMKMENTNWLKIEVIVKAVLDELDNVYNIKEAGSNSAYNMSPKYAPDSVCIVVSPIEETFMAGDAFMKPEENPQFYPYDEIEAPKSDAQKPAEQEQTYEAGDSIGNW